MKYFDIDNTTFGNSYEELNQVLSEFLIWCENLSREYHCGGGFDSERCTFGMIIESDKYINEAMRYEIEKWFQNKYFIFQSISVEIKEDNDI